MNTRTPISYISNRELSINFQYYSFNRKHHAQQHLQSITSGKQLMHSQVMRESIV